MLRMLGWAALGLGLIAAAPSASAQSLSAPPPHFTETLSSPPGGQLDLPRLRLQRDQWWARDKAKHVAFSFFATLSAQYVLVNKAGWAESDALPASAGVTVSLGLAKEVYDWRWGDTQHFSARDLVADGIGLVLAVGVIVL
jgi:uncharacterized protein YfiM (DUF2279 family)